MEIKATRDTLSETYFDALRIRNDVFVKEQHVPYELEVGNAIEEASSIHFVIYDNNKAIGTVRLLANFDEKSGLIQRMAVLKNFRAQGYASLLLENLLEFVQSTDLKALILHAQLDARDFYKKFNFIEVGDVFEEAGIQHITMTRSING